MKKNRAKPGFGQKRIKLFVGRFRSLSRFFDDNPQRVVG